MSVNKISLLGLVSLDFVCTGLSNMHRCHAFPFALARLFLFLMFSSPRRKCFDFVAVRIVLWILDHLGLFTIRRNYVGCNSVLSCKISAGGGSFFFRWSESDQNCDVNRMYVVYS